MLGAYQIGVFYTAEDSNFFDYLLKDYPVDRCVTIDSLLTSDYQTKIVFIHMPYPQSNKVEQILKDYGSTNLEFCVVATELHGHDHHLYNTYDQKNITFFINGQLNFPMNNSEVYSIMDWFRETKDHYKKYNFDSNYTSKKYYFDALLGRNKPHRQMAFDHLVNNPKIYLRYNHSRFNIDFNSWDHGVDNLTIHNTAKHSVETVTYNNNVIRISQIIPNKIYDQSYYSLVAETHFINSMVFLTEKTAKPIIAKRLFILLGNKYSLKFLHSLGFKTFNSVIDESYDNAEDPHDRIKQALAQVDYLCTQDPSSIYEKIQPVLEYNHWLMMNTDWQLELKKYFLHKFKN